MKAVFVLCVTLLSHFIKVTESGGQLRIKFVTFRNPGSTTHDGGCCDNVSWCLSSCEVFIKFCLTLRSRSSTCSLVNFETPVLGDDSFDFSNSLGGSISNPVAYNFDSWTEPFKMEITVLDDDGKNPLGIGRASDLISRNSLIISTSPDTDQSRAAKHDKILQGHKSKLTIQYQIFCDNGYFKPSCKEICTPTDDSTGHYTCDYDNSRRVCLPHWYDKDCKRYCQPRDDATGHYLCHSDGTKVCHSNWYGVNCTKQCVPSDGITTNYTCNDKGEKICLENWYGDDCSRYCKATHSYVCSHVGDKLCTDGYYGTNCSNYCHAKDRGNYRCLGNGTVICTENYYGLNCSVYCLAKSDANGSYSCAEDGSRNCSIRWYGVDCGIYCESTNTTHCLQNGTKRCHKSWYGVDCGTYCENTNTTYCLPNGTKRCHKNWYGAKCDGYCIPDASKPLKYYCDINGNRICAQGWYGVNCDNFTGCVNGSTNSSHYFCDKETGAKICHFGWVGKDCNIELGKTAALKSSYATRSPQFASTSKDFTTGLESLLATMTVSPSSQPPSQAYATKSNSLLVSVEGSNRQTTNSLSASSSNLNPSISQFLILETTHGDFSKNSKHFWTSTSELTASSKSQSAGFHLDSTEISVQLGSTKTLPHLENRETLSHLDSTEIASKTEDIGVTLRGNGTKFDARKSVETSPLRMTVIEASKTEEIGVTPRGNVTKFDAHKSKETSTFYMTVTEGTLSIDSMAETTPSINSLVTVTLLNQETTEASFEYNEVSTEIDGNIPTMISTLLKATSTSEILAEISATVSSNRTSWVVTEIHSENEGIIEPLSHTEMKRNLSSFDSARETTKESLHVLRSSESVSSSVLQSVFFTSQLARNASLIHHNYSSINATSYSTLQKHTKTPLLNSTKNMDENGKRVNGYRTLLLFIGIPVTVCLLLSAVIIIRLKMVHKGRKSKVKAINIHPGSSDLQRSRLLRSRKVAEESSSILPLIQVQLDKRRASGFYG